MIRLTRGVIFFVVCVVTMSAAYQFARACQVDEFFLSKENGLAASTPEALNAAIKLDEEGNKEKLAALLANGNLIRLKGDIKVQVLERSVEFKTLKIKLPDSKDPYWVKDGSLNKEKAPRARLNWRSANSISEENHSGMLARGFKSRFDVSPRL